MSYTFLQEQEAESSVECFSDMFQSAPLSWKSIAENPCYSASVTGCFHGSPSGMTSQHLTESHGAELWTLSVVDSLARTFPRLERVRESMATDPGFGVKWQGLSVKLGPDMCGWKTARCLWEEDLPESSVTLPNWGLMQGGEFWGQTIPGPHTEENESGYSVTYPTPKASEDRCGTQKGVPSLGKMALDDLWPTPLSQDAKHSGHAPTGPGKAIKLSYAIHGWPIPTVQDAGKATKRLRDDHQNNLTAVVANWPTPTATQHKGWSKNHNRAETDDRLDYTVEREANQQGKESGRLNPDWVEWLMGWPIGWSSTEPMTGPIQWAWDWWKVDPADSGEIPRANSGTPGRVARLKAIGNGQVPACAALAWLVLSGGQAHG